MHLRFLIPALVFFVHLYSPSYGSFYKGVETSNQDRENQSRKCSHFNSSELMKAAQKHIDYVNSEKWNKDREMLQQQKMNLRKAYLEQGMRYLEVEDSRALTYFEEAAQAGEELANIYLSTIYLKGSVNQAKDWKKAKEYAEKAPENPQALFTLGVIYHEGSEGISQDLVRAKACFQKSSDKGYQESRILLEMMQADNEKDELKVYEESIKRLKEINGAEKFDCMYQAGTIYLKRLQKLMNEGGDREEIDINSKKAWDYLTKASKAGHDGATHNLAVLSILSNNPFNKYRGLELLRQNAEKGVALSQFVLALYLHTFNSEDYFIEIKSLLTKVSMENSEYTELATYALRLLNGRSGIAPHVAQVFMTGDLDKAKQAHRESRESSATNLSSGKGVEKYSKTISERSSEDVMQRKLKQLEKFMDAPSPRGLINMMENMNIKYNGGSGLRYSSMTEEGSRVASSMHIPHGGMTTCPKRKAGLIKYTNTVSAQRGVDYSSMPSLEEGESIRPEPNPQIVKSIAAPQQQFPDKINKGKERERR